MENKDEKIQQIMNEYIKDVSPPQEVLFPALNVLRVQNQQKAKIKKARIRRTIIVLAAAAALILFFGHLITSLSTLLDTEKSQNYSISQLYKKSVTTLELNEIKKQKGISKDLFPYIDTDYDYSLTLFCIADTSAPVLVLFKTRQMTDNGIADIEIMIELSDARFEYFAEYDYFASKEYSSHSAKVETKYVNGEYESRATLKKNGLKYYVDVVSPNEKAIDYYIDLITRL